jgi:hypothetical protein
MLLSGTCGHRNKVLKSFQPFKVEGTSMSSTEFTVMSGEMARAGKVSQPTVIEWARLGLLEAIRTSSGVWLFRTGQEERASALRAERMAFRGKRRAGRNVAA